MALGPVALTTAAPQRAEEEEDRSRLHHPRGSSRAGFPFLPSFPWFSLLAFLPPCRQRVLLAGAVSLWPPAPNSALLKPCRNRPREHRPQDLHNFPPKGYFQREVSDFLPSSALAQHPADGQAGSPPKPGKLPVPKDLCVPAGAPITPAQALSPRAVAHIQLYPCFLQATSLPQGPWQTSFSMTPRAAGDTELWEGPCQPLPQKQSQDPWSALLVSRLSLFIPQTGFFQGWRQVLL